MALLAPGTCTSTPQFVPSGPRNGRICLAMFSLVGSVGSEHERMQPLTADEPGVDLVPELHARLAELPAIKDVAAVDLTTEVHETGVHPLADDPEVVQLGDVVLDVG